jgi:hypothetical protein
MIAPLCLLTKLDLEIQELTRITRIGRAMPLFAPKRVRTQGKC